MTGKQVLKGVTKVIMQKTHGFSFISSGKSALLLFILAGLSGLMGCHTQTETVSTGHTDHQAHAAQSAQPPQAPAAPAAVMPTPRIPHHFETVEAAKPFPQTLPPEQFTNPAVQAAYRAAQRIPDVLSQLPCYCYCDNPESFKHRSLLDCHADTHSSECDVCMKEALLADKLNRAGHSIAEIRDLIIKGDWRNVPLPMN